MTRWQFTIQMVGDGADMQTAWEDAMAAFTQDPGRPEDHHPQELGEVEKPEFPFGEFDNGLHWKGSEAIRPWDREDVSDC
jgi:hypothetical protein